MKTFKILIIILLAVYSFNLKKKKKPNKCNNDFQKGRDIKITWTAISKCVCSTQTEISTSGSGQRAKNTCILRKVASQVTT